MPSHGGGHMGGGGFRGGGGFHGGGHSSFSRPRTHSTIRPVRPAMHRGPVYMGPTFRRPYYRRRGGGIFSGLIVFFVFMMIIPILLFSSMFTSTHPETNGHTVEYQKDRLEGYPFSSNILDDELGITTPQTTNQLSQDLKYFYDQTGIQPYVLLSNQNYLNASSEDEYLYNYYINHFEDENVFLFAYLPGSGNEYDMYYMPGDYTTDIMDSDAIDTFWSNADYYFDRKMGNNDISWIGQAFKNTADSCMTGYTWVQDSVTETQPTSSGFGLSKILGLGIFGILAALIVTKLSKKKKENAADIDYGKQYQQQSSSTDDYNPYYGDSESYSDQFKNQNQ